VDHRGDEREANKSAVAATLEPAAPERSAEDKPPREVTALAKVGKDTQGDVSTRPTGSASKSTMALTGCVVFVLLPGVAGWSLLAAPFGGARELGVWIAALLVRLIVWSRGEAKENARMASAFRALVSDEANALPAAIAALQRARPRSALASRGTFALVQGLFDRGAFEDVEIACSALLPQLGPSASYARRTIEVIRMLAAAAVGNRAALDEALAAQRAMVQDSGRAATRIVVESVAEFVQGDVDGAKARLRAAWSSLSDASVSASMLAHAIETYGDEGHRADHAPFRGAARHLAEYLRLSVREQYAAIHDAWKAIERAHSAIGADRNRSAVGPSVAVQRNAAHAPSTLRTLAAIGALAIATYPYWGARLGHGSPTTSLRVALYCVAALTMAWAMFASPAPSPKADVGVARVARPELYALESRWALGERESTQAGYEAISGSRTDGGDVALACEKLSRLAEMRGEFERAHLYARRGVYALSDDDVSEDEGVRARVIWRWAEALATIGRVEEADFASRGLVPLAHVGLCEKFLRFRAAVREDNASAKELARELEPFAFGQDALLVSAVLAEDDSTRDARLRAKLTQQQDARRWLTAIAPRYAAIVLRKSTDNPSD